MKTYSEPTFDQVEDITQLILQNTDFKPEIGIILGTGLGGLINELDIACSFEYRDIGFPVATVESHNGTLYFGTLAGRKVVVMPGRFHYYEGYPLSQVTLPVRVIKNLGAHTIIVSNAAGGLNPDLKVSDLMLIDDHINLLPDNPLRGKHDSRFGDRFPDMSEPYCPRLIGIAKNFLALNNLPAHSGVYVAVAGPNLETKAEYKFLRTIGADAVGMSTVPEVIVANQVGLKVFAVSVITDLCTPNNIKKVQLSEILAAAQKAEPNLKALIAEVVKNA